MAYRKTTKPRRVIRRRKVFRKKSSPLFKKKVVSIVKRQIAKSSETKYLDWTMLGQSVAQVNQNATGHNTFQVTFPTEGDGTSERVGRKINVSYMLFKFQYWGQSALKDGINLYVYLVKMKGPQASSTFQVGERWLSNRAIYDANGGVDVYDTRCMKNLEQSGAYSIIKKAHVYLPIQQINNVETHSNLTMFIPMRNIGLTFNTALDNTPADCDYRVVTFADVGNRSTTASTLLGLSTQTANTGVIFNCSVRLAYKDI